MRERRRNAVGPFAASVVVTGFEGATTTVRLRGVGELADPVLTGGDFGEVRVGEITSGELQLENTTGVTITSVAAVASPSDHFVVTLDCPQLDQGQECELPTQLVPKAAGEFTERLTVEVHFAGLEETRQASADLTFVACEAPPAPTASPPNHNFGEVTEPAAVTVQLSNRGSESITGMEFSVNQPFAVAGADACRVGLQPGRTCSFSIRFAPQGEGRFAGEVRVQYSDTLGDFYSATIVALAGEAASGDVSITSVPTGRNPVAVAVGLGSVWVSNIDGLNPTGGSITRIDPSGFEPTTSELGFSPDGIAVGADVVWLGGVGGELGSFDPVTLDVRIERVGEGLSKLAVGPDGFVWAIDVQPQLLLKIDPGDLQVVEAFPIGEESREVVVTDEAAWVTSIREDVVTRVDRQSGAVEAIRVGDAPVGIAVAPDGLIWVANNLAGTVMKIDPKTRLVADEIAVGGRPDGIAVDESSVWVSLSQSRTLLRLDRDDPSNRDSFPTGDTPDGVAVGEGAAWVANFNDDTVTRVSLPAF